MRSNEHLSIAHKESIDLLFYYRFNHHIRTIAVRASKTRCCSEQAADQRPFRIDLASTASKVGAAQIGKCGLMLRDIFDRKSCNFFGGGGYRPAAIVTSGAALEGWNMLAEKPDFSAIFCHSREVHQATRARQALISLLDFA